MNVPDMVQWLDLNNPKVNNDEYYSGVSQDEIEFCTLLKEIEDKEIFDSLFGEL